MTSRGLYRDPVNSKLTGVCAGLANYFEMEIWLVRILFISAALLGGTFLVVLAYFALTLMLEKPPKQYRDQQQKQQGHKLKSRHWKQGESASQVIHNLQSEFDEIEQNVRNIEAYVTSNAYKVNKEFKTL
ncbi:envelope stress response membrane protein PspC [Vibrio sp. RC27]